jgi:hypothetical protein
MKKYYRTHFRNSFYMSSESLLSWINFLNDSPTKQELLVIRAYDQQLKLRGE